MYYVSVTVPGYVRDAVWHRAARHVMLLCRERGCVSHACGHCLGAGTSAVQPVKGFWEPRASLMRSVLPGSEKGAREAALRRREGREPLPHKVGESILLSRSGGEKGLRGSGAGTLGRP